MKTFSAKARRKYDADRFCRRRFGQDALGRLAAEIALRLARSTSLNSRRMSIPVTLLSSLMPSQIRVTGAGQGQR
jgi:hypothetical protein